MAHIEQLSIPCQPSETSFGLEQSIPVVVQDDTLGELRGYKLSVLVSGDGKRYHLALVPVSECSVAFFSNESGLIYTGKTLGCPAF